VPTHAFDGCQENRQLRLQFAWRQWKLQATIGAEQATKKFAAERRNPNIEIEFWAQGRHL
jgi:hypothetical protein